MTAPKSSSMRTPLARVRNLGSSHSGTSDFWRQRLTAVALLPLYLLIKRDFNFAGEEIGRAHV